MIKNYKIGGIVLQSEFEIPELVESNEKPDVFLKFGKVPEQLENPKFDRVLVSVAEDKVLFRISDIARYLVEGDNKITVELLDEKRQTDAEKYILSFILGVLSFKKGYYPLHGGGIIYNGEAYLFTGHSGAGKSTTIAGLQQRGFTAVADDISNIFVDNGKVFMHPCFPRFKLWKESIDLLALKNIGEYKLRSDLEKYLIPVLHDFPLQPIPVKRIYLLVEDREGKYFFNELKGKDKLEKLRNNNYKPWMVNAFDMVKDQFVLMANFANKIEMKEYHRPKNKKDIEKMFDFLIQDIKG